MIKKFLLNILKDPQNSDKLVSDDTGKFLVNTNSGRQFPIIIDVPVILPSDVDKGYATDIHQKFQSEFIYAEHYARDAEEHDYFNQKYSAASREEINRNRQMLINRIPENSFTILDAGCGGAWVAELLLPKKKRIVSMDISERNPVNALKKFPHAHHAALIADSFHLPFQPDSFDVVIASEIIEHVHDPAAFIKSLLQVLKPGGKLLILTPYNEKIVHHLCVHCNRPTPANAHLHSFNEKNIVTLIPDNLKYNMFRFNNKAMIRLRLYAGMSKFPFKLWKFADDLINLLTGKTSAFLIEIYKT